MGKLIILTAAFFFVTGCSSGQTPVSKKTSSNKGFEIVKYSNPVSQNLDLYDDFYDSNMPKGKSGFKVESLSVKQRFRDVSAKKILVKKSERKMYVFNGDGQIKEYLVSLGKTPVGKKIKMGDGKTPEGNYNIEYHNPKSKFFYSLKISYPNKTDLALAKKIGVNPGGDIFIHGLPNKDPRYINFVKRDWTNGCIAVSNEAIREIAEMVKKGTLITIEP